jgi:CheY-like chemotaxis protein/HPt (histidine-containing phosphotransfer) domain-containing protein
MQEFARMADLPTLLLIDDDMVSREVMATVLTMTGYTVHTAASGEASLELLESGSCVPAAILMDAQMPGLSGTQLVEQLRTRSKARVIAISASNAPVEVAAAADGFLLKPFAADALQKLLESHEAQAAPAVAPAAPVSSSIWGKSALDPAAPVVNPETLGKLREMMPKAAVKEIYAAIIADLYKRQTELEVAIGKDDAAEVRRIGHSIKGGCGMAGALQAARLGALLQSGALETAAPNPSGNHLDNSTAMLTDLRTAARNLESMLEQEFPA